MMKPKGKAGYLDLSMTVLGVYITVNFMQYGMLYNKTIENPTTTLILFMLGILYSAILSGFYSQACFKSKTIG